MCETKNYSVEQKTSRVGATCRFGETRERSARGMDRVCYYWPSWAAFLFRMRSFRKWINGRGEVRLPDKCRWWSTSVNRLTSERSYRARNRSGPRRCAARWRVRPFEPEVSRPREPQPIRKIAVKHRNQQARRTCHGESKPDRAVPTSRRILSSSHRCCSMPWETWTRPVSDYYQSAKAFELTDI